MVAKLSQWGNSLGIRIPASIAELFKLQPGSTLSLEVENNSIIIKPAVKDIKDVMTEFYGKPLNMITSEDVGVMEVIDWGEDIGGEVIS